MTWDNQTECDFGMNTDTTQLVRERLAQQRVKQEKLDFAQRVLLLSEWNTDEEALKKRIGEIGLEYVQRVNELLFTK